MTEESLKFQISQSNNSTLKAVYEHCCEEYRHRLCKQWDLQQEQVFWVPSRRIGEMVGVDVIGGYYVCMEDVIYIVDHNITLNQYLEYQEACDRGGSISVYAWFHLHYRPEDYE